MPDGIGPHEGRELELMLAGEKPLAMFSDVIPASIDLPTGAFAPYVLAGDMVEFEEVYDPKLVGRLPIRFVYFALKSEAWRIEEMRQINASLYVRREGSTDEIEQKIGYLLGYSQEQVADFIAWQHYLRTHDNLS